jgi:hypothetical protein
VSTGNSTLGGGTPGSNEILVTDASQKEDSDALRGLIEEDEKEAIRAAQEIGEMILNSRKVNLKDDPLGTVTKGKQVSKSALKSNMNFEIQNKDANGRSILHRAAFD